MNLELERTSILQKKNTIQVVEAVLKKQRNLILDTIKKLNDEVSYMDKKIEREQAWIDETTWENDKKEYEQYRLLNLLYLFRDILQQLISDDIEYNTKYEKEIKCVKNLFHRLDNEDYVHRKLSRVKSFIDFMKNNKDIIYTTNSSYNWQTAIIDHTEEQISLRFVLSNLSDKDKKTMNILGINILRDIHFAGM